MLTREMLDKFRDQMTEDSHRMANEPDTIECRTLPMSAVRRIAMCNAGARLILHKWQWDELAKDSLIPLQ